MTKGNRRLKKKRLIEHQATFWFRHKKVENPLSKCLKPKSAYVSCILENFEGIGKNNRFNDLITDLNLTSDSH